MGKIKDLGNAIVPKITVQPSLYYTQIEYNSNICVGMFSNFYVFFFSISLGKSRFSILAMIMGLLFLAKVLSFFLSFYEIQKKTTNLKTYPQTPFFNLSVVQAHLNCNFSKNCIIKIFDFFH